jgi:hypothetical protein
MLLEGHRGLAVKALRIRVYGEQKNLGVKLDLGGWFSVRRKPEIVLQWNIPSSSVS